MVATKRLALLFSPLVGLVLFLLVTDPFKLPLALLTVPFVLFGIGAYQITKLLFSRMPLSAKKTRFIAVSVTAILLLVLTLQSIRQLSIKDSLILVALLAGVTFYMKRIDL